MTYGAPYRGTKCRHRYGSIINQQSRTALLEERTTSGLSRKRLSHQTERFLSVADKLYPAWQVRCIAEWCSNHVPCADREVIDE